MKIVPLRPIFILALQTAAAAIAADSAIAPAKSPPPLSPAPKGAPVAASNLGTPEALKGAVESKPELKWKSPSRPDMVPEKKTIDLSDAAIAAGRPAPVPIDVVEFAPGIPFKAELPLDVRNEGSWVGLDFTGSVNDDPKKGATVTIDQAVIGFQKQGANGDRFTVRVMVRSGSGESAKWELTNLVLFPGAGATASARDLKVQFHPKDKTWDLYAHNNLIRKGVPYEPSASDPEIAIDTGEGDRPAELRRLILGTMPRRTELPTSPKSTPGAPSARKN